MASNSYIAEWLRNDAEPCYSGREESYRFVRNNAEVARNTIKPGLGTNSSTVEYRVLKKKKKTIFFFLPLVCTTVDGGGRDTTLTANVMEPCNKLFKEWRKKKFLDYIHIIADGVTKNRTLIAPSEIKGKYCKNYTPRRCKYMI